MWSATIVGQQQRRDSAESAPSARSNRRRTLLQQPHPFVGSSIGEWEEEPAVETEAEIAGLFI
jgi:hypothetical protein